MRRFLKVKFSTISDAEEAYDINYFDDSELASGFVALTKRQQEQLVIYLFHEWLLHTPLISNNICCNFNWEKV